MNWIRMPLAVLMLAGMVTLGLAQQQDERGGAAEQEDGQRSEADGSRAGESSSGPSGEGEATDGAAEDASGSDGKQQGEGEEADRPSAERVLQQLLRRRAENPLIEPAKPDDAADGGRASRSGGQTSRRAGDLRREGEFVVQRRGRMVRASEDPAVWMFVFNSGGSGRGDPPMMLMPCRYLEEMESIVRQGEASDSVEFILSGQVFVYRGSNYLLPTMVKRAPDRGNLNP